MENLKYKGYTGILGGVFDDVNLAITDDEFIVSNNAGNQKKYKIEFTPPRYSGKDFIYHFINDKVMLCSNNGIKHFLEAENKKDVFFVQIRSLLERLLKTND